MPILLIGNHICECCHQEFDWVDFELIKNRISQSSFIVERIPTETQIYRKEILPNGFFKIFVYCPRCGYNNIFEYKDDVQ